MASIKKPAGKQIMDVAHPGKSAPSNTSKPVIVSNRPVMQDPMVNNTPEPDQQPDKPADTTEPAPDQPAEAQKPAFSSGHEVRIQPLATSPKPEPKAEPEPAPASDKPVEGTSDAAADDTSTVTVSVIKKDDTPADTAAPAKSDTTDDAKADDTKPADPVEAEAAAKAKHEAEINQLAGSKKYYLSINSVEKRKTQHFVIMGVVLSIILAVAWVDIALDAGIIQINGIDPVTHLFSN